MRKFSKYYILSTFFDLTFAGFLSGNLNNVVNRNDRLVNITISGHLREVLKLINHWVPFFIVHLVFQFYVEFEMRSKTSSQS